LLAAITIITMPTGMLRDGLTRNCTQSLKEDLKSPPETVGFFI
jgi:hypothetical protein